MPGLWDTTVTPMPDPSAGAPQSGGLWGSLGNSVDTAITNPLFQFGIGMAGAGGDGKGLGGGLAAGLQNAPNAWKMLQAQRQMKFQADISDLTSPLYKQLLQTYSPAQIAIMASNPDGPLELGKAQATNSAELNRMMALTQWQQNRADAAGDDLMKGQPGSQPSAPAPMSPPTQSQNYPRPQSQADLDNLAPGTLFQAPDGTIRRR